MLKFHRRHAVWLYACTVGLMVVMAELINILIFRSCTVYIAEAARKILNVSPSSGFM